MGSAKFKRERAASQLEKQNHVPPLFSALCSLEKSDFERLISQVSGGFQLDLFIQIASRGAHYDRKFEGYLEITASLADISHFRFARPTPALSSLFSLYSVIFKSGSHFRRQGDAA